MDYVKLAATVVRLIAKNGRTVTLHKLSGAANDPAKPWKGPGTPTLQGAGVEVKGVFVPATGDALGREFISEELLARASEVLLVAPNATDLEPFNVLLDNLIRWRVEWCYTLKPADTVMLYAFGVCR